MHNLSLLLVFGHIEGKKMMKQTINAIGLAFLEAVRSFVVFIELGKPVFAFGFCLLFLLYKQPCGTGVWGVHLEIRKLRTSVRNHEKILHSGLHGYEALQLGAAMNFYF